VLCQFADFFAVAKPPDETLGSLSEYSALTCFDYKAPRSGCGAFPSPLACTETRAAKTRKMARTRRTKR
jgi:hypothetical protein